MSVLATLLPALLALGPQDPADTLARFQLGGKPAVVTRTDVALEMAFHLRRREEGQQACEMLIDALLTRRVATAKRLMPSDAEVRQYWADLQVQLRAAGRKPEDFPAVRNGEADLLKFLAVQMAQERLLRQELGLANDEAVSGDMLRLWQQEARKRVTIVTDADALPAGTAARVDDEDVPMLDLGLLLLRTSEDADRDEAIHRVVYLQSIEALARQHGVEPGPEDLQRAVAARRAEAAKDPRYRGLSFDQLIKSQGMTVESLKASRVFRAKVLLAQLAARLHPDADLHAELQRDRQALLDLVGPRRRIGIVFVRALDEPNGLIPLDFPAALKKLAEVRVRLAKERFDTVARIESQEPMSKAEGGDTGWHTRKSSRLPETVLAAAFALANGACSEPLRDVDGCYLTKVLDVEPDLGDDQLVLRLREYRAQELSQKLIRDAKVDLGSGVAGPEKGK